MNGSVECTSLCSVWTDSNNQPWLIRIADLKNGRLAYPNIDEDLPKYFDNRDRLYWNDGPRADGTIGVWRWKAIPRDTDVSRDYVTTEFCPSLRPTRFILERAVHSIEALQKKALEDVTVHTIHNDTVICYEHERGKYTGILCKPEDITYTGTGSKKINRNIDALPVFKFDESDILRCKNGMQFIKTIPLKSSTENIPTKELRKIIYSVISDRLTWPLYKDCIGKTKAEWRECRDLFEKACSDSLYQAVAEKIGCRPEDVIDIVDMFTKEVNDVLQNDDIDTEILARIAMNHEGLRTQCETVVEEKWKKDHSEEISAAQAEVEKTKQHSEEIVSKYRAQFEQIKAEKEAAELDRQSILQEVEAAQHKLDQLLKDIEEYETLGDSTVHAIQNKIAAAQQDMAGFLAELSAFMPQQSVQSNSSVAMKPVNHWTFTTGAIGDDADKMEECCDWNETLDLLQSNLQQAGVGGQWAIRLSFFLYSAYLNRMPVLLAGPNAMAIGNALSLSTCGKEMDMLKCSGEPDQNALLEYTSATFAAVENPFHPDWISGISTRDCDGFYLWLHPFTEDLQIEPRSLYNYAYPVFTECFVDQMPSPDDMIAGNNAKQYKEFQSNSGYRAKIGNIKQLGMSRLVVNRLEKVLADAKCMGRLSDMSMEYLFGILPLSVLVDKKDAVSEMLGSEKNLPTEIKSELQRYIEA